MAEWKTALDREESQFGILKLTGDWKLTFPILHSAGDIDPSTRLIWGTAENLKRCTVLTLPFSPGSTYRDVSGNLPTVWERLYKAVGRVTHVLVGATYIAEPATNFVREISFVPQPNRILHEQVRFRFIQPTKDISEIRFAESCELEKQAIASATLAYFEPERGPLVDTVIASLGARLAIHFVTGRTHSRHGDDGEIAFRLYFNEPRSLHTAIEEAYIACVFLSFISHQQVTPAEVRVLADGNSETHELHFRPFKRGSKNPNAWGHTLVLPDRDPVAFEETLRQWYGTNENCLRSRYLYAYSLRKPYSFSNERFLAILQSLEGLLQMPSHKLFNEDELNSAEKAIREALPARDRADLMVLKLKSIMKSPSSILKSELPMILAKAGLQPTFDVKRFVDNIYRRRNRASHGGSQLSDDSLDELMEHTVLTTALCVIAETQQLGLDARASVRKFAASMRIELPLADG